MNRRGKNEQTQTQTHYQFMRGRGHTKYSGRHTGGACAVRTGGGA